VKETQNPNYQETCSGSTPFIPISIGALTGVTEREAGVAVRTDWSTRRSRGRPSHPTH
jgi:hypothetical protein